MNANGSLKVEGNVEISCNASNKKKGNALSNNIDIPTNDLDHDETSLDNYYLRAPDASFASWPR